MKVSVVMPVYNGETTLEKTLRSLLEQADYFHDLIVINDASTDSSLEIIKEFIGENKDCRLIENEHNLGLAKSYNKGIRESRGDLIVTMHQDIFLPTDALKKLIAPFQDENVVAAGHSDIHPSELWKKYNFWQKCFSARFIGRSPVGINGQFDCFRKSALEKAGLFDDTHYRTAGEDGDMVYKLKKIGKVVGSEAKIIHMHKSDPNFGWRDIIRKQAQYADARGALFSRGRIRDLSGILRSFFRELMILGLLIPYVRSLSALLIVVYSILNTKKVFLEEYKDRRIFILPFLNIYLLFVSIAYSLKGFISRRQTL